MQNTKKPVTLLYVGPNTEKYMKAQCRAINDRQGTTTFGLATFSRAVLTGLCEAKTNFAACRGENDVTDLLVRMLTTPPTPAAEVLHVG